MSKQDIKELMMIDTKNGANLAIQMYGAKALKAMLKQMPKDSMLVAISRNKFASIFYKYHLGEFEADYGNAHGWTGARQVTLVELEQDLNAISFMLIDIEDLKQALEQYVDEPDQIAPSLAIKLNGLIEAQIARAQMRRDADHSDSFWKGQLEAYAILQNAIRPHL